MVPSRGPGAELRDFFTGTDGVHYETGIPPQLVRPSLISAMKEEAYRLLPSVFANVISRMDSMFVQAIYDLRSERMGKGRIALIGDAAFVARPHCGAGVAKAADDAVSFATALEMNEDIETAVGAFSAERIRAGKAAVDWAAHLGSYFQMDKTGHRLADFPIGRRSVQNTSLSTLLSNCRRSVVFEPIRLKVSIRMLSGSFILANVCNARLKSAETYVFSQADNMITGKFDRRAEYRSPYKKLRLSVATKSSGPQFAGWTTREEDMSEQQECRTEVHDGMLIEWDVPITTNDGTALRCDVFRPNDDGKYPVIMGATPYGKLLSFQDEVWGGQWKLLQAHEPEILKLSSNRFQNYELPDPERFVPDGYALVRVDVRGTGRSPGFMDLLSRARLLIITSA